MDEGFGLNWMTVGLPIGVAVALGIYLLINPEPEPPPKNDAAFGCYAANNAPPIRLDNTGMHILQDGIGTIGYHLEVQKTGIVLTAERPIQAQLVGSFYRFSIAERGIGMFLPFFRDGTDTRYGVLEGNNLHSFEMITDESNYLLYRETDSDICEVGTEG